MDPREIDLDQFESMEDIEEMIGGDMHPAWGLACQFRGAHDIPEEEWVAVKKDSWMDEDEEWNLYLNGSGTTWQPAVSPIGDDLPNPCRVEVFAGAHLVRVNEEALAILHPTHIEYFCDREAKKPWGHAIICALRDRLVELGMDLPPVSELAKDKEDDS